MAAAFPEIGDEVREGAARISEPPAAGIENRRPALCPAAVDGDYHRIIHAGMSISVIGPEYPYESVNDACAHDHSCPAAPLCGVRFN